MKLNNKGFAITAVLYGLLILFVILVSSYLVVLSAKKDRVEDLVSDIENDYTNSMLLVDYINNLYNDASKSIVTNNSIQYNYAGSVNLMNDRLGGTTTDYNAGNIRYYGANPNNYIDIGDRDSSGNVILYRIIGLFKNMKLEDGSTKDLVKVIRTDPIGTYSWDNKVSGVGSSTSDYGSNDWSDARLMMLLNPGYESGAEDSNGNTIYEYEGSLWWNSKSGTCYAGSSDGTKTCNFTSTGLSKEAQNKIETVVWNIGGITPDNTLYSDKFYIEERGVNVYKGRPTTWIGKVALMYASDYGYAVDFNSCSNNLEEYNTDSCYNNDWLYISDTFQWQLNPYLKYNHGVARVFWKGNYNFGDNTLVESVRPVFYLNSNTIIKRGDGSQSNPFRISI